MNNLHLDKWVTTKKAFLFGIGLIVLSAIYMTATVKHAFPFQQARNPAVDGQMSASYANNAIRIQMSSFPGSHRPEEVLPFVDLVVLAEITQIDPARWNTTDCLRPADWGPNPASISTWMIYTPFAFKTIRVLKGNVEEGLASQFAVVGGQVGDDQISLGDGMDIYSDITIGDQVILFLGTSTGNMVNVAPYTYGDALRIDGTQATADCGGSRAAIDCRVAFSLPDVLARITSSQNNGLNTQGDVPAP